MCVCVCVWKSGITEGLIFCPGIERSLHSKWEKVKEQFDLMRTSRGEWEVFVGHMTITCHHTSVTKVLLKMNTNRK